VTSSFYTLRYLPGTDLRDRKHRHTQVRAETWVDAEDARLALPERVGNLLEVVERGTER
jgi:hypothetical protein